jgi:two-component system nitrogen regulation response regulator GlnG
VVGRVGPIPLAGAIAPLAAKPVPRAPARDRETSDDELLAALAKNRWNTSATATALGISRTTLYALIDRSPRVRKARDLDRDEIVACREELAGDLDRMAERLQVSRRGLQLRMRELGL